MPNHTKINYEERRKGFRFDWTLNVTSMISIIALIFTIAHYGSEVLNYLKQIDARTNIMWTHFDKSQMTKDELVKLGLN